MYDQILVPTDGSSRATAAATHALSLARQYDARLHVLYVMDVAAASGGPLEDASSVRDRLTEVGQEATGAIETRAADVDVPVVTALLDGAPAETIIEYVGANDVDLVVMGTHGRSGLPRYLLGSVTERVIRSVGVPVLTVSQVDPDATVTNALQAVTAARDVLQDRGYGTVQFPEDPYLHGNTWIVRARASGETFNVHVDSATRDATVRTVGSED